MNKKLFLYLFIFTQSFAQTYIRNLKNEQWFFRNENQSQLYPAQLPGSIHTDLYKNKLIEEPFFAANEKNLQWIENENWVYECTFMVSQKEFENQNINLNFEGLDTYATIFLNDVKIAQTQNMFRNWNFSVKNTMKIGKNKLKIIFDSAVKKTQELSQQLPYTLPEGNRVFARKAQYHFGWDWAPRFVTCGIWKPVQLLFWNKAQINTIKYEQNTLSKKRAELAFSITVLCSDAGKYTVSVNNINQEFRLSKGINTVKIPYTIMNPKLWWTNGLGKQNLYDFKVQLFHSKTLISNKKIKIGLKTLELIQDKDEVGSSFYFKLNGIPVFMKGANYIPEDSFLNEVTREKTFALIHQAKQANMNMLRVWGGGTYASDNFYEACDKAGILVWQDFMFACAMYPSDDDFVKNVKAEVIDNVNRIQNHASLALFCGNNENKEGWYNWGWQKQHNYSKKDSLAVWNSYQKVFQEMIPKTLDSLLPKQKNIYWESSPSIGWGRKESILQGDSHYWGVWWGKEPFEVYQKKIPRFMSEYGFQATPAMITLQKIAHKEDLNLDSPAIKNHQKHPTGYETIDEYMRRDYVVPSEFENYNYVSQLLQAYGMKTAIEAHRQAKPYCMGTLYWQLNDCWAVTSWSSVDYYGSWKASHYQVKKSYENVILSVEKKDELLNIYCVNDSIAFQGNLAIQLIDFNGKKLWEKLVSKKIKENSSEIVSTISLIDFKEISLNKCVLKIELIAKNKSFKTLYYFVKPKELQLEKPTIKIKTINKNTIEVTTNVLAKNVFIYTDDETHFSDNYFDLLPTEKKIIKHNATNKSFFVKTLYEVLK